MNKYFVFVLALTLGFSAIAQKKELKTAAKELKKNNLEAAVTALDAAEALMSQMDDKSKSQYYLLRSKSLFNNGEADFSDVQKAAEALSSITSSSFEQQAIAQKQLIFAHLVNTASSLYEKNDYLNSSDHFENAYRLSQKDTLYLYYAASTAVTAKAYDKSLSMYEELKSLGFTGIEKQYFATNKEDQKEESFNSKVLRDVSVKSGTHTSPTDKLTDSKFPEIIKNIALIYVDLGDNDKALEAMLLARSENPDNVNLLLTEANVHYKMGNVEKFKELLEMATQMDPNNAELQYNLGVVSAESNDIENATKYYQNAIELKPDYTNAYINLAALILGQEEGILSQMNALGSSASDDRKYDQLKAERNQLYLDAIPYLEKAIGIDPTNFQAVKTLSNIYSATGNTEKFKEYKALAESLEE